MKHILGIIGGYGPETTADFYIRILNNSRKRNLKTNPHILLSNSPIEIQIQNDYICENKNGEKFIQYLVGEAKRLENAGATVLCLPCNTLHKFYNEIKNAVNVPVISIIESTVEVMQNLNLKTVGLCSTGTTILNRVYNDQIENTGIKLLTPKSIQQAKLNQIITRILDGKILKADKDFLHKVVRELRAKGAEKVFLACTDLQVVYGKIKNKYVMDTMAILADKVSSIILDGENGE
jgi:aspartate racemase